MSEQQIDIHDLVQDDKNFNQGTARGKVLLDRSFERFGAARSVLVDKNNRIIAGNKSTIAAEDHGISKVRVVETTGKDLVVVKRTDLDIETAEGREYALADNMTAKQNFSLSYEAIREAVDDVGLDPTIWGIDNLDELVEKAKVEKKTKTQKREDAKRLFKFKSYVIAMTDEEYDALMAATQKYLEENGVLIGFIAELLNI